MEGCRGEGPYSAGRLTARPALFRKQIAMNQTLPDTGRADSTPLHRVADAAFPSILALADLEAPARRKLPRMVYGYYAGSAETESSLRANRAAYEEWGFRTRLLRDVSKRSQKVELFGRTYDSPFGISPMGGACLAAFRGDTGLARAASSANVPFILSGASTGPMEDVHRDGGADWFQAYLVADHDVIAASADRAAAAGYKVLVVTADVPVGANRENNVRTGYSTPLRLNRRVVTDGLTHPRWLIDTLLYTVMHGGVPRIANDPTRNYPIISNTESFSRFKRDALTWDHIAWLRQRWKGRLVLKGVLSPADAVMARDAGLDGIIVSNHGGRQLDGSAAPLRALPAIVDAVPGFPVMMDGGARRGSDILKAVALGARLVFIGRPFMYALAVGGEECVYHSLKLLRAEVDRNMAMLGCADLASINRDCLMPA